MVGMGRRQPGVRLEIFFRGVGVGGCYLDFGRGTLKMAIFRSLRYGENNLGGEGARVRSATPWLRHCRQQSTGEPMGTISSCDRGHIRWRKTYVPR